MAKMTWDLLIVGGGPGGIVLALELGRKGYRIAILDRQSSPTSFPRGEIIQPNGLKILDHLGLLSHLRNADVHLNNTVHFYQAAGRHLCTIDYRTLPGPYAYSLILLPEVMQHHLLKEAAAISNIEIFWGANFEGLLHQKGKVAGAEVGYRGEKTLFRAPVLVGGDGVQSRVRDAFHINYRLHHDGGGYVTTVIERPSGFHEDSRYYLGKGKIFGAFPVSKEKCYIFYLVPSAKLEGFKKRGLHRFKDDLLSLNREVRAFLEQPLKGLTSWEKTAYMHCFRTRCDQWVVDGGALLGDAAHAMNPHVAQGRNTAMEDGMALAEVLEICFQKGDFSRKALLDYEMLRRSNVDTLQRLGDEMTWLWNSGWTPLVWARDRIFRAIHHHPDLHAKMLTTVAGLDVQPFNLHDRWQALHLWSTIPESSKRKK